MQIYIKKPWLLGSTEKVIAKSKNGENVPKLGIVNVILMDCKFVNNSYQQASKVLFTFVPNKQFGQLITIASHSLNVKNYWCRIWIY